MDNATLSQKVQTIKSAWAESKDTLPSEQKDALIDMLIDVVEHEIEVSSMIKEVLEEV